MKRIEKLREKLWYYNCEAVIIEQEVDLYYLTGLKISTGTLVIKPKETVLLVDSRYYHHCQKKAQIPVLLSSKTALSDVLGGEKLGFDSQATSYQRFLELQKICKDLQPIESPVKQLRMIKDEEEIALLRKAAVLGSEGFDFAVSLLREGVQEKEVACELDIFWKKRGAQAVAFEPIIAFGANSAMPHYRHGDTRLKWGMNALIDIGVINHYYHSDMTRVIFFGEPDPTLKKIYGIVAEAQKKALELCRPGVLIGDVDRAARDFIASQSYGDHFGHSLGHGIGLEIHEMPLLRQVSPYQEMPLQKGMVITIEPGIYIHELGGVRLEDSIVITEKGYENLTNRPIANVT